MTVDVAIFGGGIAGLWLLRRLRAEGYDAALIEPHALGAGQTLASQGIIHSGVKYTFDNILRPQTQALAAMPDVWMRCIEGRGEVDLRGTGFLARHQLLFTTGGWSGRVAGLASKALRGQSEPVAEGEFPAIFRDGRFRGQLFRLHEPILETRSVVRVLGREGAWRGRATAVRMKDGRVAEVVLEGGVSVTARAYVFAAGAGNEWFAEQLGLDTARITQRRPLRMFLARGVGHSLYAHCMAPDPKPRVTITTHFLGEERIWYLGGNLAERAVGMSEMEALRWAHSEMNAMFPWLDWRSVQWAVFDVDRAEPAASRLLPSGPELRIEGNAALGWPTKLALAPALAAKAMEWLDEQRIRPSGQMAALPLPPAEPGKYPWEMIRAWKQI